MKKTLGWVSLLGLILFLIPSVGLAQSGLPEPGAMASQNLRGYTHMFIAYFIAWILILGWIVSIARRLGKLQKSLEE